MHLLGLWEERERGRGTVGDFAITPRPVGTSPTVRVFVATNLREERRRKMAALQRSVQRTFANLLEKATDIFLAKTKKQILENKRKYTTNPLWSLICTCIVVHNTHRNWLMWRNYLDICNRYVKTGFRNAPCAMCGYASALGGTLIHLLICYRR